jgi:hypothetical protein
VRFIADELCAKYGVLWESALNEAAIRDKSTYGPLVQYDPISDLLITKLHKLIMKGAIIYGDERDNDKAEAYVDDFVSFLLAKMGVDKATSQLSVQ